MAAGGCLCGAVRFTAELKKQEMDVCHCGMCRRWSGGIFMAVEADAVEVADEVELGVYRSSGHAERMFCKTCGSSLFWRMQDGSMTAISFQALDDTSGFEFGHEIFIDEKPPIYEFANPTHKMTGAEVMAAFEAGQP